MNIVLIYRDKRLGFHSIEVLFSTVANELRRQGENVIEYRMGPRSQLFSDIFALRKLKADVYHVTGDVHYVVMFLPWHKTLLTIHDLYHLLFSLRGRKRLVYKWIWFSIPIFLLDRITVISDTTANDLISHFRIPPHKVIRIENCYSPLLQFSSKNFDEQFPRILQVGTKDNKNVPRVIRALRGIPCQFTIIGYLNDQLIAELNRNNIIYRNLVDVSQEDIVMEYENADLVTFVSLAEGFGVPILEAQATGKPLITSNLEPMATVAGAGACLADPTNIASIRHCILKLIHNQPFRYQVVSQGLKNVLRYSPKVSAMMYLNLYMEISGVRND